VVTGPRLLGADASLASECSDEGELSTVVKYPLLFGFARPADGSALSELRIF